jgi:HlyD family secretion protein
MKKPWWRRPLVWLLAGFLGVLLAGAVPGWIYGPVVEAYAVVEGPLVANVVATGRVETPSRVTIGSEIAGILAERLVTDGDRVAAGQVVARLRYDEAMARVREAEAALAQFEARDRPAAQAALREAEARLAQAQREAERQRDLAARGLVARELLERAEEALAIARAQADGARVRARAAAPGGEDERVLRQRLAIARAQLAKTEIRALVDGIVLRRLAEPGDVVGAGRGILELARDGDIEIVAQVDERNLGTLAVGQKALASADAFPDRRFDAEVRFIAPGIDPQTGTIEVRLRVIAPPDYLRQDMTVSVDIETARRERALSVPADALREVRGDRARVLVVRDGRVEAVEVRLGLRGLGRTEVLEGLAAGDAVLPGDSAVAPGSRVRARRGA